MGNKQTDEKGRPIFYWGGKNNKQQTAVGYIISQLRQLAFNENTYLGMGDVRITQGLIDELEEQAKQMEKEQIKIAYNDGADHMVESKYEGMDNYYKLRYGSNNQI